MDAESGAIMELLNFCNASRGCCRWAGPERFTQCLSTGPWSPACSDLEPTGKLVEWL